MYLEDKEEIIEEWWVGFKSVQHKHWIQLFLKTGFHHCYAFKRSPGGKFLVVVEPMRSHVDVDIVPNNTENLAKLSECHKLIRCIVKYDLKRERGHFCRFNCVEVVKSLLGIKNFWIFTPEKLYRSLKNGQLR